MTASFECMRNAWFYAKFEIQDIYYPLIPTLPRGNAYAEPEVPTLERGNEKCQALVIDVVLRSSY